MDTRSWSTTWRRWSTSEAGEGPFVLAGHSMGAHTAVGYALRHPERLAGLVVIGPTYTGDDRRRVAALLGRPGRGARGAAASTASSTTSTASRESTRAWRDSVLRFTRERMLRHRHLDALVVALREVPRSRPFEAIDELRGARGAGPGRRQP